MKEVNKMNFLEIILVDAVAALLIVLILELMGQGDDEGWLGNLLDWVLSKIKQRRPVPSPKEVQPRHMIAILYQIVDTIELGRLDLPSWQIEEWIIEITNIRVAADRARALLLQEHGWWGQKIAIRAIVEDRDGRFLPHLAEKIGWRGDSSILQHQDRKSAF
ncbi:hypothetical protein A3I42_04350 [Candidatus Uhrbacteria bacterium RIFCSPLOWO2_02_FULL_49_11]|uniref:Uncharacterized protein n=1 Tax=Candidatus Uhrbacteria bacterium RIFCSPLOWO2_02_FULL_49_11 TaxID=1802409 RepID=A0A1F7VGC1_9BACT|nr:MAG: hypothetical protein A3I42_04350 [Candidatus Uhrbacteria bacterium RIFCSPLOWO2_02_FULL_49_11]